ncbi:GntR family transcriptional regulator [Litoribrevibacter euphylliae]|uniref:GntR family transcriptional regulator n=1 Tax=Litoribrevibacter euphylliae TaxID=1834034 RepID=A0ABV7HDF2_9GAMM
MNNPEVVNNLTLAEQVLTKVQEDIVTGDIAPGTKISESALASKYGVSRGPLREAISRLESRGLIERAPNVGARVVSLSHRELIELYQIRENLEGLACRLAAEKMTSDEIAQLEALLQEHQQDKDFKDGTGYYKQQGDLDFHYCIIHGSKNRKLIHLLCEELYHLILMYRHQFSAISTSQLSSHPEKAFIHHKRIVEAIADRDGELAEMLMKKHIQRSRKAVETYFDQLTAGEA